MKLDGEKLFLRRANEDFEVRESSRWWQSYMDAIIFSLDHGKIMAHLRSGHVDAMVLINETGKRITIRRPWKLW